MADLETRLGANHEIIASAFEHDSLEEQMTMVT